MVYIFFVQPGDMMTFDNEISIMQSVGDLKEKIKEKCGIPLEQQVLLINGGESLDAQKNLCSYMAGTDTNPIYLFSTNYDVSKLDILRNLNYNDSELKQRLLDCLSLPVSLSTVKTRALLAQDFYNVAREQLEFCENMVHEQHLQQQGWSAVIANLEDIVLEFRKRWELFLKMYEDFIADRDAYDSFLISFEEDKKILQKIPVIDSLLESEKDPMDGSKISETTTSTSEMEHSREISLYEWISSSDSKNSLDELYELCRSNLQKFEKEIMPSLEKQINDTLQSAEKPERKEIEGLGKRLFDLEELLRRIKKYVDHQSDMAQSFLQNQNSVAHLKDTSILPDLCATHVQQIELIKQCHQRLMDDRNRIVKAKYELSKSLCTRIGWVQNVEDKLWELDSLLVYFHEHLQRLRKHLEVFQQLHLAPVIYMNAVVEVVRRRSFSQIFLLWSSDLACQQLTIHNEEVTRRKEFGSQFEGHFLNALFPGMGDVPPPFATEAPPMFDAKLPNISEEDVEKLKKEVPNFADHLVLPDMNHVVNFFMGKISAKGKEDKVDDAKAVEEKLMQAVSDVGLASNFDKNLLKGTGSEPCLVSAPGLPNLKDDKGCESETDTEEFEKVGQSPLELTFPQGVAAGAVRVTDKQDASTITDDNLQISRSEHEKLKTLFLSLSAIAKLATTNLRNDLNELKAQFVDESRVMCKQYEEMGSSWDTLLFEVDRTEKEIVQSMQRVNEAEKERYRYNLLEKEDVIRRLEEDKRAMEDRIQDTSQQFADLEKKMIKEAAESTNKIDALTKLLEEKDLDKERCLKELSENLKLEHRAELDNIKSRFKLMKVMERSPSLTSLEKEKFGDYSSLPSPNTALLVQMTENFELDKEKAVDEERKRWEKILEENIRELQQRFDVEKDLLCQDIAKRISEEKDKQIDVLREREKNQNLEISKYRTTIQQLVEYQEDKKESELFEQIELLKREKEELQNQLVKVRSERDATTSGLEYEGKPESTISPLSSSPDMSKSETVSSRPHRLNIDSCKIGDIVLVWWDQTHENFKVLQESRHDYFVHTDCLEYLGLRTVDGKPSKLHCIGEVVGKEYIQIRKSINRFKVSKGSKFFLVKVKPITTLSCQPRDKDLTQSEYTASPVVALDEESGPEISRIEFDSSQIAIIEQPEELIPKSVDKQLAEDSGIVENIEQATAALEDVDRLAEEMYWSAQGKHLTQDKEKLIEEFRERERHHNLEIIKYKETIQQLSETNASLQHSEEFEFLRQEREYLQQELAKVKSEREALMSTSVAVYEGKLDAATSPLAISPSVSDLSRSEIVSSRPHRLNIDSCKVGDIVLLFWDQAHENFKVLQESKHTYFLHSESLDRLGLTITEGKPSKIHCTGEVMDKEYCQTRKSENRYKVPKGARFFRVKVKPIPPLRRDSRDLSRSSYTARHASPISSSQTVIATFHPLIEESQPAETLETSQQLVGDSSLDQVERCRSDSETTCVEHDKSRTESTEEPVEAGLKTSSEKVREPGKHFAEDSGIEEATPAVESSDRCEDDSCKENLEQSTYISANWLEAMFRSMFTK